MKFSVCIEMEAYNSDGSENDELGKTTTVVVEVDDSEEKAIDKAMAMNFGVRRPSGAEILKAL